MANSYKYPIKVVSQMTGLSVHVIRAWEKRYSVVEPDRTDTNRRLYSEEDIEKLKLLNDALRLGHHIGGIANLSLSELKNLLSKENHSTVEIKNGLSSTISSESSVDETFSECIEAIKNYDAKKLESVLLNSSTRLTQPVLLENLVVPLVYKIGEMWHNGEIRVANEHLASSVIRGFLFNLLESYSVSDSAPVVISATPRGQDHELGALIVGVVAASSGWKVIYLGSNLPAEEIGAVVSHLNARIVALSIVYPNDDPLLPRELRKIKQILPSGVSIIAGGRSANGYLDVLDEIGALVVKDSKHLRLELEAIRENKYN
ncbi:MAG: MerR family transcriptional regulator [Ignavibacteriaceae bacterium]|jgi:DNA-binding transcriptional MerR regulator/methylmalonyl-CoA mutase cobalamin-binding subunit|nr:MerR family transcriptional regulator [Ignavibacteriaceae bacterium]MCU0406112.1 MerR family transcriptional regulator [Ignavibacteriaceae bacterium]MCU0414105.1 MerR family transcriptional regulator [Ignavibacteriaceae bacterium]